MLLSHSARRGVVCGECRVDLIIWLWIRLILQHQPVDGMNPNYDQIGKSFVQQYYAQFDVDAAQRANLGVFYSVSVQADCNLNSTHHVYAGEQLAADFRGPAVDGSSADHGEVAGLIV